MTTRTIVVADDDEDVREMLRLALQPLGQEVIEAADSDSAWREVLAHWPAVLVSDVAMPQESGLDLCRRLTKSAIDVRVVIYTAGLATEEEALGAGAAAFLSKSEPISSLRQVVADLCAEAPTPISGIANKAS